MKLKDIDINIEVLYKPRNKRTYFRYDKETNTVSITSPNYKKCKNPEIFIHENEDLLYNFVIKQRLNKQINNNNKDNNMVHFFGKSYNVKIELDFSEHVSFFNDEIIIHTTSNNDKHIDYILYSFYQRELDKYIKEILPEAFRIYKENIFDYKYNTMPSIIYKRVKTFYGKCYTLENKISLNIILAKYNKLDIKNVLYHELTHFVVPNHGIRFYYIFELCFPNAKKVQTQMKKIQYNDRY